MLQDTFDPVFPIARITPSTTNPRTTFDDVFLAELAESIKKNGVIEPLILRPHKKSVDRKELVCGENRLRAAQLAGAKTLPVIIRNYSDDQCLEIQLIENLQRQGVHPLEEGIGFKRLLGLPNFTVEILATKVSRPERYIRERLQLTTLIGSVQKLLRENKITIGHALEISKFPAHRQNEALGHAFYGRGQEARDLVPLHDFREALQQEMLLDLAGVPWDVNDPTLVAKAGSCAACSKRSGSNLMLFEEMAKTGQDLCLDSQCFELKAGARLVQIETDHAKKGSKIVRIVRGHLRTEQKKKLKALDGGDYKLAGSKSCDTIELGLFAVGAELGKTVKICRNKKCKVHIGSHFVSSGSGIKVDYWKQKAEKLDGKIAHTVRVECVRLALSGIKGQLNHPLYNVPLGQLRCIAGSMVSDHSIAPAIGDVLPFVGKMKNGYDARNWITKHWATLNGDQAVQLIIALSLRDGLSEYIGDRASGAGRSELQIFIDDCAAFQVNHAAVDKKIGPPMREEFNERRKRSEAKKAKLTKTKAAADPHFRTAKKKKAKGAK